MAASIPSSVNSFACETLPNLIKHALSPINRISFSAFPIRKTMKTKRNFTFRAAIEGDGGADDEPPVPGVSILEEEAVPPPKEIEVLKKQLLDSFYGTNRGLSASSETRAEIVEFITQLEAENPNPAPTQALALLNGKWILAECSYTSFLGFYPLLSREGAFSLVKVEEISHTFNSDNFTVQNSVLFCGPLATTSVTTNAKFEVRSPKRVQIKFDEGVIETPQLTDSIVLPENMEFFGQNIDLSKACSLLYGTLHPLLRRTISSQPPLKFSISSSNAESWLLTTYLDDELRVSRGDGGSIFVLIKEGSPLLTAS